MNVDIGMRSGCKRELVISSINFFIQELNLERSRFNLTVVTETGLRREQGANGMVFQVDEKEIAMILDSRLNLGSLLETVAHEMVHVKQIAKGSLRSIVKRGKTIQTWLGKPVNVAYHCRPWELEAFRKERELTHKFVYQLTGE